MNPNHYRIELIETADGSWQVEVLDKNNAVLWRTEVGFWKESRKQEARAAGIRYVQTLDNSATYTVKERCRLISN